MRTLSGVLGTILLSLVWVGLAWAIPGTINYQGVLTDSGGLPLNGTAIMTFRLFDAESDGNEVWNETQDVTVSNGNYSVQLGSDTTLAGVDFTQDYWLEVVVEDETLIPRKKLNSVPYAMSANSLAADSVDSTAIVAGAVGADEVADGSILFADISQNSCGSGQVMKWDGNAWACANDADTNTNVGSVDGLLGGTINGDVTINDQLYLNANTDHWDVANGDYNLRIGSTDNNLSVGVATDGGGAGITRLYSVGTIVPKLILGSGATTDVLAVSNDKVGIGEMNPLATLHVGNSGEETVYIENTNTTTEQIARGLLAITNGASDYSSSTSHYGIGSFASGGTVNYGLDSNANDSSASTNYGVSSSAFNGDIAYGVYGYAYGGTTSYGVFGRALGGTDNWAGYFDGDVHVTGTLSANLLATDSVDSTAIASGVVGSDEITDGSILFADISQNSCGSGQVMKWDGSEWACANDVDTNTNIGSVNGLSGGTINGDVTINDQLYLNTNIDHWDVVGGEYNLRIGSSNNNLSFGVATGGGGAGTTRLYAVGTSAPRVVMGTQADSDVLSVYDGKVGIGTLSPTYKFHVTSSDAVTTFLENDRTDGSNTALSVVTDGISNYSTNDFHYGITADAGGAYRNYGVYGSADDSSSTFNYGVMGRATNGTNNYAVYGSAGLTTANYAGYFWGNVAYTGTLSDVSDRRLKENIRPLENPLEIVDGINGVYFNMYDSPDVKEVGVIAQDVQTVLPEAVSTIDEEGHLGVSYTSLVPVLIEAVKELRSQNEALRLLVCQDHPAAELCQ